MLHAYCPTWNGQAISSGEQRAGLAAGAQSDFSGMVGIVGGGGRCADLLAVKIVHDAHALEIIYALRANRVLVPSCLADGVDQRPRHHGETVACICSFCVTKKRGKRNYCY